MQKQKGFTIIELIVVIAIIAVLAGIVLVNVNQYIKKSRDAAIKANMAEFPAFASKYFETYGSFSGSLMGQDVCEGRVSDGNPEGIVEHYVDTINKLTTLADPTYFACEATPSTWASCINLNDGTYWCVDNTGAKMPISGGRCSSMYTHAVQSCQ